MSDTPAIELRPSRRAARIGGPDAEKLLNDVVTGTILAAPGPARWWALLTPQGKIAAEGLVSFCDGAFWLDIDQGVRETFLKRMRLYKLRARAEIEDLSATHSVGWSPLPVAGLPSDTDSRGQGLGHRIIAPNDQAGGWREANGFLARRIAHGLVELGPDFGPETSFPHDIAMDLLGGIDFAKGCYVGQEVVSRMKHRGTARRRPVLVAGDGLTPGAAIVAGNREAGTLASVLDGRGVAILRLDRIADPTAATVSGRPVALALPSWADYAFGDSGGGED